MKQNTTLTIAAAAFLVAAAGGSASAQPGAYAPPPPPAAAPAPAPPQGWDGVQKFGVGLRLSTLGLTSTADPEHRADLGGGGLQLRYRLNKRWEFEFTAEGLSGETEDGGVVRESSPATLSVLMHMRPSQPWDWYLLAGVGSTHDTVSYYSGDTMTRSEEFQSSLVHMGAGLERRFQKFGVSAELRLVAAKRNDDKLDAIQYGEGVDGPVAAEANGGQLSIIGTYYF